jgi:hypothetical protein
LFKPLSGPTTPSSPTFPNGASYIEHTITVRQYDGPITVPNDLTISSLGGVFNTADYSPAALSTSLLSNVKNEAYPKPILNADCVFTNSYNDIVTNTPYGKLITRFWQVKNCGGSNLNLQANAQGSVVQRIYVNNTMNSCPTTLTLNSKMSNPSVAISAPVSCKLAVKSNFNAIQSMKFTINYDPSLLDFVNIQSAGLNITNSDYNNASSGKISFVWTSATPITLANDAEIFQLNFTRKSLNFLRNNAIYITGDIVPIEVINQNLDCVNVAFDACSPDFTQTYNTSICPSSVDLSNFIPAALKTPNRTFTYHDISNGATLSSSIVSPTANTIYYIKSLTSEGCMDETSVAITIKSVTACSSPSISNQGGPVIVNPCTCFGNKLFAEGIVILSLPNQIWTVQNTTFLNMNTGLPFPPGTVFTELPGVVNSQGYVRYSLVGYHKDAAGYIINAVSSTFPNLALSQSNFCFSTH